MIKTCILIFLFFVPSCFNENILLDIKWTNFSSKEAGFTIKFPCEPKKSFYKSFQDKPRPIHVYEFDCGKGNMKFLVSTKHYMDEFNNESIPMAFEAIEGGHKQFYAELKETEKIEFNKLPKTTGKLYKLESENGKILYHLALADNERIYSVMSVLLGGDNLTENMKKDFDKISQKFRDSLEITKSE